MQLLVWTAAPAPVGAFVAVLVFGLVVAVAGHIVRSRTLILTGILIIGATSVYFSFVLQPGGR